MPDFNLNPGRPQLGQRRAAEPKLQVAAGEHNYGGTGAPADDPLLSGLINGLSVLNPALQRADAVNEQLGNAENDRAVAERAAKVIDPQSALKQDQNDPLWVAPAPAYGRRYREGMAATLGARAGILTQQAALADYRATQFEPDFSTERFISKMRTDAYSGVTNPAAVEAIGKRIDEAEGLIRGDQARIAQKRLEEQRHSTATVILRDAIRPDMTAEEVFDVTTRLQPELEARHGFSKRDQAPMVLRAMAEASEAGGGMPEMIAALRIKGDDGKSWIDWHPEMAPQAAALEEHARKQVNKIADEDSMQGNAKLLADIETRIENGTGTEEEILYNTSARGVYPSDNASAAAILRLRKNKGLQSLNDTLDRDARNGVLNTHESKEQQRWLTVNTAAALEVIRTSKDPAEINKSITTIFDTVNKSGSSEVPPTLKNYFEGVVLTQQGGAEPSGHFLAVARAAQVMPAAHLHRWMGESATLKLQTFNDSFAAGSDTKSSMLAATAAIDPANKELRDARVRSPEFKKLMEKFARFEPGGSSFLNRWLGGNGRPINADAVGPQVAREVEGFARRNPFATEEQLEAYGEHVAKTRYVMNTNNNKLVPVPIGMGGDAGSEAMSNVAQKAYELYNVSKMGPEDHSIEVIPTDEPGTYVVAVSNGINTKQVGAPFNLQNAIAAEQAKKAYTQEERVLLGNWRDAYRSGSPLPAINPALIEKASHLKLPGFKDEELKKWREDGNNAIKDRLNSVPAMGYQPADASNVQPAKRGTGKVDFQLTGDIARRAAANPNDYRGLAMSLITTSEGTVLTAYNDPAKGAGQNIAMGYNLKANAHSVDTDLHRAGVQDPELREKIKNGTASLTPAQAERLTAVSMERYERLCVDAAKKAGGDSLWESMQPAQKAVMIDIAWQMGNPAAFKQAWAALVKGDTESFQKHTKVFYTNHAGERVEDTRRGNLRAAILSGPSYWNAIINRTSRLASSKLPDVPPTAN